VSEVFLKEPQHLSHSRDIIHCHPYLRERWPKLVYLYQQETSGDLIITCTWRSAFEQKRLYALGRTEPGQIVTQIDGTTRRSNHNVYPARALDVAVNIDPQAVKPLITWQEDYYRPLGKICEKLGLVWGGSWTKFPDMPHIELPSGIV